MPDEAKKKVAKQKKAETEKEPEGKAGGEEKRTCFIIMPITTPREYLEKLDDPQHFEHVRDLLFVPAIEAAGLRAIPPNATGAQNIQAEIIKNLETADLVLCDMSSLNANVFFELGVRTALDKPVCLVTDDVTAERLPFDTSTINRHIYSARLEAWHIDDQKSRVQAHIGATMATSSESNTLWRYFSMTMRGEPEEGPKGLEERVAFLFEQLEALTARRAMPSESPPSEKMAQLQRVLSAFRDRHPSAEIACCDVTPDKWVFRVDSTPLDVVDRFVADMRSFSARPFDRRFTEHDGRRWLVLDFGDEAHLRRLWTSDGVVT